MRLHKTLLLLSLLLLTTACDFLPKMDEVIPDRRTEYKKSESLPDLEVPPDLTVSAEADPLLIPNDEATTLSQFENQKKMRHGKAGAPASPQGDEQWLSVQGSNADIWPKLKEFWIAKGYTLDLDDQELGVLETNWLETAQKGAAPSRTKYSIFAEAGSTPGSTVLFLSSRQQEKIAGKDEKVDWADMENDVEIEKQLLGELNLLFYGKPASAEPPGVAKAADTPAHAEPAPAPSVNIDLKARAELQTLSEGKVYLSLPDEFNRAWGLTERAILDAGIIIDGQDRTKGTYNVTYSGQEAVEKKKGLLSKLKFWGDKEEKAYQISLTGVGKKTELVVLNENGDWASQDESTLILTLIQAQYNSH